jgi:hypothetical protein
MPSKMTAIVFALGVIAAAVAMWALADHSVAKVMVFLVAMLCGSSFYFLLKAQEGLTNGNARRCDRMTGGLLE